MSENRVGGSLLKELGSSRTTLAQQRLLPVQPLAVHFLDKDAP